MKKVLTAIIFVHIVLLIISGIVHQEKNQTTRILSTALKMSQEDNQSLKEELEEEKAKYVILEKDFSYYRENGMRIRALDPLRKYMTAKEILELMEEIPTGIIFDSGTQITASFGESTGFGPRGTHFGVDAIPNKGGSCRIFGYAPGVVTDVGTDKFLGKYIEIEITPRVSVKFGHLSKIYYRANIGCSVDENTVVGIMGNTGRSNGAHVHVEIIVTTPCGEKVRINGRPYFKGENTL